MKRAFYESFLASNMLNVGNDVHDNEYSSLIVTYTTEKTTIEILSIVEVTIDTIASRHQLSRCIDLSMYCYTPSMHCGSFFLYLSIWC